MKYILFVLAVLLPNSVHAQVRMSEIAWMGTAESQYSEWFELYNDGTESISLSGWKLVQGDGAVIFTLTKPIGAGEYLLVERTTATAPDAVPGIDDESGPFGASGFANTGEDLVLKDASGTTIETLSFADGWPAGDATTKATIQWSGTSWITSTPTPKAPTTNTDESGNTDSADQSSTQEEKDPYAIPRTSPNKPHIAFSAAKTVYAGVAYLYEAHPVLEYGYEILEGDFAWNMGDGTRYWQTTSDQLTHMYRYPGTYSISFLYTDPLGVQLPLRGVHKVSVVAPSIALSIREGSALEIKNTSSTDIDLSGWSFVTPMKKVSVPDMTVIAAKSSAVLPFTILSIGMPARVMLMDPGGALVASTHTVVDTDAVPIPEEEMYESPDLSERAVAVPTDTPQSTPIRNHTKAIIFGVVALFVIGLSILLERFMARQEYTG